MTQTNNNMTWEEIFEFLIILVLIIGIPLLAIDVVQDGRILDKVILVGASIVLSHIILHQKRQKQTKATRRKKR